MRAITTRERYRRDRKLYAAVRDAVVMSSLVQIVCLLQGPLTGWGRAVAIIAGLGILIMPFAFYRMDRDRD